MIHADKNSEHNFWDLAAVPYDFFISLKNGKVNKKLCEAVAKMIESEDYVLECACGTGMISEYIAEKCADLTECKEYVGPHQFGFNKKSHVVQIVLFLIVAAVLAGVCMLF